MKIKFTLNLAVGFFLILLGIFLIYHLVLKILGGSLQANEILGSFIVAVVAYLYHLTQHTASLKGNFQQFEKRFESLEKRFDGLEKKFERSESEIKNLASEIRKLNKNLGS